MKREGTFHRLFVAMLVIAAAGSAPALAQAPQLITNGGFEDAIDFNSWTVERAFTGSYLVCATQSVNAHGGQRFAAFGAHESQYDSISKSLPTTPGGTYRVSFWLASNNIAAGMDSFLVLWNNTPILDISNPQA